MKKRLWQIRKRHDFKANHGFSLTAHYACGGNRADALKRDGFRCVKCGVTDEQHKARWGRPITVDHIDRDRKNNALANLQTLCLTCHGRKDLSPGLIIPRVPKLKDQILQDRADGCTYQTIADRYGFSIASIWKWIQIWKTKS